MYFHVSMVKVGNINIPLDEEKELYYYGPLNDAFSDSFLVTAQEFLKANLKTESVKKRKSIFLALVELVQNVSEYNQKHFESFIPRSCTMLNIHATEVFIRTANQIVDEDVGAMKERFQKLLSLSEQELEEYHKDAMLNNKSLGLFMIRKMDNSQFAWKIQKDDENKTWLYLQLKTKYGDTTH